MNLSEFKAWFDGFTENLDGKIPSAKAWKRIRERVAEIKAEPTPIHRIIHDYPWYRPYWYSPPTYLPGYYSSLSNTAGAGIGSLGQNLQQAQGQNMQQALCQGSQMLNVSNLDAFQDMGRQEATGLCS